LAGEVLHRLTALGGLKNIIEIEHEGLLEAMTENSRARGRRLI
jgi:hypothetical protein